MTDAIPFQLNFRSTNGRSVGGALESTEGWDDLFEYTSWLRVRSDVSGYVAPTSQPEDGDATGFVPPIFGTDGFAVLIVTRSHQDLGGRSIGMFCHGIEADELDRLRRMVELTPWRELPRPTGGQVAAPQLELHYSSGDLLIQRKYNASCGNFRQAIRPLEDGLHDLMSKLMAHPVGVLGLEVRAERREEEGPRHWTMFIKLENRGVGPIVLADPRTPSRSDDLHVLDGRPRLELRIGELESEVEGSPPDEWTVIPLPPPPEDAPPSLVLAAGTCLELSTPWVAPRPGKFLLTARWQDYGGPVEPVAQQLPFMPLPGRGVSAPIRGPYPVRGGAFANRLVEVPAETKARSR